jgi:hypothetical protein
VHSPRARFDPREFGGNGGIGAPPSVAAEGALAEDGRRRSPLPGGESDVGNFADSCR